MSTFAIALEIINDIFAPWYIAAAEVFLYGSVTSPLSQHRFLAASTILLFILGTAHCALQLATTIFDAKAQFLLALFETTTDVVEDTSLRDAVVSLVGVSDSLMEAASGIYVTSNIIADSIFIFRCYAIWGCRRNIVILPIILTLAVAGLGYSNVQNNLATDFGEVGFLLFISSVATSLFTTFILMGLTVGRIWWLAREARHVMGRKVADRYYTVCAMILESGALYCLGGNAFLVVGLTSTRAVATSLLFPGAVLAQLVGIAPTIIAVRVGLGYSVENVGSFIAAVPRTRPPPQVAPGTPSAESLDDRVLYIHADGVKIEGV
ncbi:hypothetical protein C8R44DRAFT_866022 [Mycena epipterygia]|nr:hypothetical protein C8R44DRAFT_866022 [Mycena epipterygia]